MEKMMTIYVAVRAENQEEALKILKHENLCLETRASLDKGNIERFISLRAENNAEDLSVWIGFRIQLPEGNIMRI